MVDKFDNITQNIETLNACDSPPSEKSIDKLLSEGIIPEKPASESTVDIVPNLICKNVFHNVENIMFETMIEEGEYSDEEIEAS